MKLKHKKERKLNKNFERTKRETAGKLQKGITLIALVITIIFSYDKKLKCSNNNGFLLATI